MGALYTQLRHVPISMCMTEQWGEKEKRERERERERKIVSLSTST